MDQKYLVSFEYGAGSLSNTEIGKKTLDMRISSEYSCNPAWNQSFWYLFLIKNDFIVGY